MMALSENVAASSMNSSTSWTSASSGSASGAYSNEALGFAAVVLAVITFGSWGVPLKIKAVRESQVDNVVFQSYSSLIVTISGFFVLIWSDFVFSWWGVLGAFLWIVSQIFGMNAVTTIGVAIGIPIIAGVTIITSFFWGVILFGEVPSSLALSIVGIAVILLGIVGVSQSQTKLPNVLAKLLGLDSCVVVNAPASGDGNEDGGDHVVPASESLDDHAVPASESLEMSSPERIEDDDERLFDTPATPERRAAGGANKSHAHAVGIGMAVICGLINGTIMVLVTLFVRELEMAAELARQNAPNAPVPNTNRLTYLISFSIGVIMLDPFIVLVYHLARRQWPYYPLKATLVPGILCGLLWFAGNIFAIYATANLGHTVGYPLTETNLIVAACWGLAFREIKGFGIVLLIVSAVVLLSGAGLLLFFGNSGIMAEEPPSEP